MIGPIRYQVDTPLKTVTFALEPNSTQPISFEWTFEAIVPPLMEDRTFMRQGYRAGADLVRYHQIGLASGWVEVDGDRTEITPDTWVSTRDHSWGVRYDVGLPPEDTEPGDPLAGLSFRMIWSPDRHAAPRRQPLRHVPPLPDRPGPGLRPQARRHGRGGAAPTATVERFVDLEPELDLRPRQPPAARRRRRRSHWPTARAAPSASRPCPTPGSISAPASTSASTATTTANGVAISTSSGERIADCTDAGHRPSPAPDP